MAKIDSGNILGGTDAEIGGKETVRQLKKS
jgi:hypothetical protein